jgi:hypothetical protein
MRQREQRAANTDQNDADILHRTISEQPLEIVLRKRKRDPEEGTGCPKTDHHPARRIRHW